MVRASIGRRLALSAAAVFIVVLPLGGLSLTWAFHAAVQQVTEAKLTALATQMHMSVERSDRSTWTVVPLDPSMLDGLPHTTAPATPSLATPSLATPSPTTPSPATPSPTTTETGAAAALPTVLTVTLDRADYRDIVLAFKGLLWLALGGLALALTAMVVAQILLLLRPLRRLERNIARLKAGEISRLPENLPQELVPLSAALNDLVAEQSAVISRVRGQISKLAHGLKTELAVAGRVLDDTVDGGGSAAPTADNVAEVRTAVRRLGRLVERYLERPSVITPGSLTSSRVALAPLADDFARLMQRLHADKALTIATAVPADLTVRGDRCDIEEMLGSLVDNACRHAHTTVRISARTDSQGRVCLSVEDDGPGMSEDDIRAVLHRGVRLREDNDGTGIGLALVEETMALYDGTLTFARSPLGGLTVTLTFAPQASRRADGGRGKEKRTKGVVA